MNEPDIARDYQERDVKAAYSVLIELGQVLGAWREKFVIVGGAVPWLLLGEARPKHIGTLDIDLDLNPDALAEGEYATLVEALEKKGYERGKAGLKPLKGYALVGRDKKKDAYDIYFSARNFAGGPAALSLECALLMGDEVARKGYEHIAGKFSHADDFGPKTVRLFLEESAALGDMTPEQIQTDAFMQVSALLRGMGLQK